MQNAQQLSSDLGLSTVKQRNGSYYGRAFEMVEY